MDSVTGRGYRVTPGAQDLLLPVDSFSKTDFMATLYHASELDDQAFSCAVDVGDLVNGESIDDVDVVVYYRGGVQDVVGSDIFICKTAGPTLTPIGNWGSAPCSGTIGNYAWDDQNYNGIQDPGEPFLGNVQVSISGQSAANTTTSAADGSYTFTELCDGEYTVTATPPAGMRLTIPEAGSDPTVDSNRNPTTITLSAGNPSDDSIDFGFVDEPSGTTFFEDGWESGDFTFWTSVMP